MSVPEWVSEVEAATAGEATARERVLLRFTPLAKSTASRLVGIDDVEDVVQSSMAEALRALPRLRVAAAFPATLRFIVRKQASLARRHRDTLRLDDVTPTAFESAGPAAHAEAADLARRVDVALRALADSDRHLLHLRYLAGWSNREIADLLGIGDAAVRKRLFDARRRARPHLESLLQEETPMTDPRSFLGVVHNAEVAVPTPPALARPADVSTTTGLKVIDALAPVRRGGTIDLLGPYGTGHLVLAFELLQRFAAERDTAMVLVASNDRDVLQFDPKAVVTDETVPGPNAVVLARDTTEAAAAFAAGARLAANLAHAGVEVALVVTEPILTAVGADGLRGAAGIDGAGAVTAVAVRTSARGGGVPDPLHLDATLVLSIEQFVLGIYPALDPSALESIFEPAPGAEKARRLLAEARSVREWFGQPLFVAETYTGEPGTWTDPDDAARELAALTS